MTNMEVRNLKKYSREICYTHTYPFWRIQIFHIQLFESSSLVIVRGGHSELPSKIPFWAAVNFTSLLHFTLLTFFRRILEERKKQLWRWLEALSLLNPYMDISNYKVCWMLEIKHYGGPLVVAIGLQSLWYPWIFWLIIHASASIETHWCYVY